MRPKRRRSVSCYRRCFWPSSDFPNPSLPDAVFPPPPLRCPPDWALVDRVPVFTVGESDRHKRTFWTQLWISTPELSAKSSEDELIRRYRALSTRERMEDGKILPTAGPSPPVLDEWLVDGEGKMSGRLDGRTVWFVAHLVGRIAGDEGGGSGGIAERDRCRPGGFVEAVGGRVYELGRPREVEGEEGPSSLASDVSSGGEVRGKDGPAPSKFPWVTGATATAVSALLASTILSASIGYGAGLGLIVDSSRQAASPLPSLTSMPSRTVQAVRSNRPVEVSASDRVEPSASEKRAKKEAQVLREERVVRTLSDKLERDRTALGKLRLEEKGLVP